jgi:uncharacterized protein HemX
MAKIIDNIEEVLANTDTLEFPKMKIDFTNDIEKVLITSDVDDETLKIKMDKTSLEVEDLQTNRLIIKGIDVTDEILELFLKNSLTK